MNTIVLLMNITCINSLFIHFVSNVSINICLSNKLLDGINIPVNNLICGMRSRGQLKTPTHLFAECSWIVEVRNELSNCTGFSTSNKEYHRA